VSLVAFLMKRRRSFDILYVGAFDISLLGTTIVGSLCGKRIVARYASMVDYEKFSGSLWGWLSRSLVFKVDHFIVNSATVRSTLIDRYQVAPDRISLIANGIGLKKSRISREAVRASLAIVPGEHVFINVSSFYEGKNQQKLILQWRDIYREFGTVLILVGGGPSLKRCKGAVPQELFRVVRFLGARRDVVDLLCAADGFVFPSSSEGISNALLEAMACGLPCLANDIPANADVIRDGISGILFSIEEEHSLYRAMKRLVAMPEKGRAMGAEARKSVMEGFSLSRSAEGHVRAFNRILAGAPTKEGQGDV